jgi:hypothetical protein
MSTPAAAALDGAGAGTGAGGSPAAGAAPPPAAPPAANQAFYSEWVKGDAPENKELSTWLQNKNFPDPATLAKSYRSLETESANLRAAANLKGFPSDFKNPDGTIKKADPNAIAAWRAANGVPATAADYKLEVPSNTPYPQFTTYLQEVLHEAGVPAAQAPLLAEGYEKAVAKLETELRAAEDRKSGEDLRALEVEWGPNYKERVAIAARGKEWLSKEVGGLNDIQMRTLESVLTTPKFMKAMWKMGAGNQELGFPPGGGTRPGGFEGGSVAAAQAEYDQLMADRSAGKITDAQWRATGSKREQELAGIIAGGFAAPLQ